MSGVEQRTLADVKLSTICHESRYGFYNPQGAGGILKDGIRQMLKQKEVCRSYGLLHIMMVEKA